jgi:hypothetical protein
MEKTAEMAEYHREEKADEGDAQSIQYSRHYLK